MSVFDYSQAIEETTGTADEGHTDRLWRYQDALHLETEDPSVGERITGIYGDIMDYL